MLTLVSGVAGLHQQHGTKAGRNVTRTCAALAGVGEPAGKAGARMHLQQQLRQVHPGSRAATAALSAIRPGGSSSLSRGERTTSRSSIVTPAISSNLAAVFLGGVDLFGEARDLGKRIV
jgi:hypothetical protein